jgi:hypothetical protein
MKRILIAGVIACTIAALPATASAQQVGVKAGVNSATLDGLSDDELTDDARKRRIGLVAGVWVRTPVSGRFSFQAEALFSEKGVKFEEGGGTADIRLRFIEVPLLGHVSLGTPGSDSGFFVVAGVAPAFKLSGRGKFEFDGVEETEDFSDDLESMDLGLVGGAGFEFGRASVEARYTHGLRNLVKDEEDTDNPKSRVFSVLVGYRFR